MCPRVCIIDARAFFDFVGGAKAEGGTSNVGERMFFRGAYLSVLSMHSCIRLGSIFLFFLAVGFLK